MIKCIFLQKNYKTVFIIHRMRNKVKIAHTFYSKKLSRARRKHLPNHNKGRDWRLDNFVFQIIIEKQVGIS